MRPVLLSLLLVALTPGAAAFTRSPVPHREIRELFAEIVEPEPVDVFEPLTELVGKAESDDVGGYDAANAGYPMDLGRDGLVKVFGRPASEVTVGEILLAQDQGRLHAVGRFQIIGVTLQKLVDARCITGAELFTDRVQDRAFRCLIENHRPAVWHYLKTGDGIEQAADAMALEWSSLPWRNGHSYYGGADRAHATREQLIAALEAVRRNALSDAEGLS